MVLKLVSVAVFQSSSLFFVTFDIMLEGMFVQWNLDITNLHTT